MNNKKFEKTIVLFVIIITIVSIGGFLLYKYSVDNKLSMSGKNRHLLNEINESWTLDDRYVIEKMTTDNVPIEWLHEKETTPQKAILQLHGGAYRRNLDYGGNLYRRMAEHYALISDAGVLTVDYRIAPTDPYPAALEDALSAYNWLLDNGYSGNDIIIAGDSAGGGLTHALTMNLRDNKIEMPCAVVTMSAWTDLNYRRKKPSYVGDFDAANPYISPVYGNYSGFPPMLMQVGTKDITSDTTKVAEKATAAGVDVIQTTYNEMVHIFQALAPRIDDANTAWNEVQTFITNIFNNNI